ncbi:MAG: hypothetical protein V4659_05950 [Pseudomonadota bacterium]
MRSLLIGTFALSLAGCGQVPRNEASATADQAAPGVDVTAAPGVAFDYRYAFKLPGARIAGVQEAHAQACERLGIARCRITGMTYRLVGDDAIDATLAFKLEPSLARAFGKQGIDAIVRAQGMLIDAAITGTDAGAEVAKQGDLRRQAQAERTRLDTALARPNVSATERSELQRQRAGLQAAVASATSAASEANATLARTPVTFAYESGRAVRSSALTRAFDTAVDSATMTFAVLVGAVALLGPPALALAALWFGWLWLRRRIRDRWPAPT